MRVALRVGVPVREGERVAEVLQVGGKTVPGAAQPSEQGQGRGAVRAGVGQKKEAGQIMHVASEEAPRAEL